MHQIPHKNGARMSLSWLGECQIQCAADTASTFQCSKGLFSDRQLSADALTVFVHIPPPHPHTFVCMLKIPSTGNSTHLVRLQRGNVAAQVAGDLKMMMMMMMMMK